MNPAAVKRFYTHLLGWELQDVQGSKRPYSLIKAEGRFIGGIVQPTGVGKGGYSQWLGYLSVPDVDRAVSQIRAVGGKALVGSEDVQNIGRAAVVADPQGAPVGLVRSEPGDPADMGLPQAGQILWMEYLADDAVAAVDFYKGLLGCAVEERSQRGGLYSVLKEGEHPRAGILRKPVERVKPNWLTYVRVDDPAAAAARAEQLGGRGVIMPRSAWASASRCPRPGEGGPWAPPPAGMVAHTGIPEPCLGQAHRMKGDAGGDPGAAVASRRAGTQVGAMSQCRGGLPAWRSCGRACHGE